MKPSLQTRSESVGLGGDGGRGEITHYNDKYLLLRNYGTDKSKVSSPRLTHKDALVLEGRQEGQGITTISVRGTVPARFVHSNRKPHFFNLP